MTFSSRGGPVNLDNLDNFLFAQNDPERKKNQIHWWKMTDIFKIQLRSCDVLCNLNRTPIRSQIKPTTLE